MRKFSKQKHYYIKHKYRIYRFIDLKEIYLFIFGYKSVIKKSNYFQKKNQKKLEDLYIKQKAAYLIIFGHLGFFTFFFLSGLIIKYPLLIIIFPFLIKAYIPYCDNFFQLYNHLLYKTSLYYIDFARKK